VKRCGALSAFGIFKIFRPRLGLHRQSCSSVFHCYNFFKVLPLQSLKTNEKIIIFYSAFYFIFLPAEKFKGLVWRNCLSVSKENFEYASLFNGELAGTGLLPHFLYISEL
jgi:hypothetical protein